MASTRARPPSPASIRITGELSWIWPWTVLSYQGKGGGGGDWGEYNAWKLVIRTEDDGPALGNICLSVAAHEENGRSSQGLEDFLVTKVSYSHTCPLLYHVRLSSVVLQRPTFYEWRAYQINPFTPKSDQFQISPAAPPEILHHHIVWKTWLFIAYPDERGLYY